MSEKDWKDDEKDPELTGWLRLWEPPMPSGRLDDRVGASYRSGIGLPFWKRVVRGRVVLPVPIAALLVVLLVLTGGLAVWALHRERYGAGAEREFQASTSGGLADLRPLPEIRMTVVKGGGSDARP
jgi:hypothetical protein